MQTSVTFFRRAVEFIVMVCLIYITYIPCGVYHQKILKSKYLLQGEDTPTAYPDTFIITFVAPFMGWLIASVILKLKGQSSEINNTEVPFRKSLVCGIIVVMNSFTANEAIVASSYSAVIMIKSCTLLSVIMVGVFCSRVTDKRLKLGKQKFIVGLLATIGIFIFNYYYSSEKNSSDQNLQPVSILWLTASLFGDGFLPDFQAEIKSKYRPSSLIFSRQINFCVFMITLLLLIVTTRLFEFLDFFMKSGQFRTDILMYSMLNSAGQQVVYIMINRFRQHITPMVIVTRKCFTVIANILYFSHPIQPQQLIGIGLVFFSLGLEVYLNNRPQSIKIPELQESESNDSIQNARKEENISILESENSARIKQDM